jgi:DNA-binding NarL/FixJ family response regulator
MLASGEIDFVVADSLLVEENLDWLRDAASRRGPLVVILGDEQQPLRIQQLLDAGADCLLSRRLPQSILESELRELVALTAKRLADPVQRFVAFPNGSRS